MVALGPLWSLAWPGLDGYPAAAAMVMATNMTIGMVLRMRIRRHAWRPIVEMSAAMYLPFVLLFVPYWLGAVSGGSAAGSWPTTRSVAWPGASARSLSATWPTTRTPPSSTPSAAQPC